MILHNIDPVYDKDCTILILGSFPSVKSRESAFFYGHPQNRFWKVIATLFNSPLPLNIPEKKELLLKNHIAVWDVIHSCNIKGSSDSTISDVTANDIELLLDNSNITRIFCNGNKSFELYNEYILPVIHIEAKRLPSTSPANAAWNLEKLVNSWAKIKE